MFCEHTFHQKALCVDRLVCGDQGDDGGGHWDRDDILDCGGHHACQVCVGSSDEWGFFLYMYSNSIVHKLAHMGFKLILQVQDNTNTDNNWTRHVNRVDNLSTPPTRNHFHSNESQQSKLNKY